MKLNRKKLKPIIASAGGQGNQYLPVPDEEGNILLANAEALRLKKVSAESKQKLNIFRAFMKNTPNMIWVADEESNLVYANHMFLKYFRLDKTALNKKITGFLPLAVTDALYKKHLEVLQTGLPLETVEEARSADGTLTIFRLNLFLADDTPGKKLVAGIATDISEKKKIEKNLDLAWKRITQLNNITSDAIWEWDMLSGGVTRNQKMMELTGYFPENEKGLSWWLSLIHSEDRDLLTEILKEVTDKNLQSWQTEYRFLCADGEYRNMHDRGFVIYENGMPVKMIGSLQDVTDEKLMQNLLLEERMRQYRIISENTMRVQEQERTRFGRELHDNVNQILSTIQLFVGMLTPANDDEKDIKQKTIEYTRLAIEEIRKLSREMITPQLDRGMLAENIRKIIVDIELSTDLKIKFTHDHEIELLSPGMKTTLFRMIQEQLKNILKYSKATRVEIFLQCNNNKVQLIVKDNGVGFDNKKIVSGVGLSGIRDRAKFYNGTAEIQSATGEGCLLEVNIPFKETFKKAV